MSFAPSRLRSSVSKKQSSSESSRAKRAAPRRGADLSSIWRRSGQYAQSNEEPWRPEGHCDEGPLAQLVGGVVAVEEPELLSIPGAPPGRAASSSRMRYGAGDLPLGIAARASR